MPITFDDLIPNGAGAPASGPGVSFDDLIPKQPDAASAQSGALGLKMNTQTPGKLLGAAVPFDTGDVYYKDAAGNLKPTDNTRHTVADGKVYERQDGERPATAGDLGKVGLEVAKALPVIGPALRLPGAASDFYSGEPGAMSNMNDILMGLGGPGQVATRGSIPKVPTEPATPPKALSAGGQAAHDAIADAITSAKTSGNPRAAVRSEFRTLKDDEDFMSGLNPDQQSTVKDLANTPQRGSGSEAKSLSVLALESVMPPGLKWVPSTILGGSAARGAYKNAVASKRALKTAESLRQSVIDNDAGPSAPGYTPPTTGPWGDFPPANPTGPSVPRAAPAGPDPQQLKLQMDALVNQVNVRNRATTAATSQQQQGMVQQMNQLVAQANARAKVRAASQQQTVAQAQPLLQQLAAQNKPVDPAAALQSQIKEATDFMAARRAQPQPEAPVDGVQDQIKSAMDLMAARRANAKLAATGPQDATDAQYHAADQANSAFDRRTTRDQATEASQLMAARRANAKLQAGEEAPEPVDTTPAQIKEATDLMAARKANASLNGAAVYPPTPAKIIKKMGKVQETPAQPEPAPAPATEQPQVAPEPQAAPVEPQAAPQAAVEEAPVPGKGELRFTKVNAADRSTASEAADAFAKSTGREQHIVKNYEVSVANKQARIRDRLLEATKDEQFPHESIPFMEHLDQIRSLRSRSALEHHLADTPNPELLPMLKRYFGPKWAASVWKKQ